MGPAIFYEPGVYILEGRWIKKKNHFFTFVVLYL